MYQRFRLPSIFILLFLFSYFLIVTVVLLHRFYQYEVFYFDHGIYDSSLWQAARGHLPLIDHLETKPIPQLGDHFNPSFYLLAPLYWFTDSYLPVIVIQAAAVTASGFFLLLLARHFHLPNLTQFALVFAYLLFLGTQNTLIAQLHPEVLAMLTLMMTFWAYETSHPRLFWFSALLTLGLKEIFAAPITIIGLITLTRPKWKRSGWWLIIISATYFLLTTRIIMPSLAGRAYQYQAYPNQILNPWLLINQSEKQTTILISLATFCLLPIFAGKTLILVIQDFISRFMLSNTPAHWSIGLHHNASLAVILAYTSAIALSKRSPLRSRLNLILISFALILLPSYLHQFKYHGPLGLAFNPAFFQHSQNFAFLDQLIAQVPTQGNIMTMNNLLPHLTHGRTGYLLRLNYADLKPEYIILDTRDGQNPNNYWPLPPSQFQQLQSKLYLDPNYYPIYQQGNSFIYARLN